MGDALDAILPAAGRLSGDYAAAVGTTVKALIALDGKTVLERTIATLRGLTAVNRIVVVAPQDAPTHPAMRAADAVVTEWQSALDGILLGLTALQRLRNGTPPQRVFLVATDAPFLTAPTIATFLDACPPDADLCVPIVRWDAFARRFPPDARFPRALGFWARLRDGIWRIGNALLVKPDALVRCRPIAERCFNARKSPVRIAHLLGWAFIVRYLLRQLTVDDVRRHCERLCGCRLAVIPDCPPELAFDLDTLDDYRYALAHWRPF